nr:MAG TPA: allergen [Caudoviricetes sp.]
MHGGSQTPENRRYGCSTLNRGASWQVICVSNTITGARQLAALVVGALDARTAGDSSSLLTCRHVSTPVEDRDDPSEWRWSVTVEVSHHT